MAWCLLVLMEDNGQICRVSPNYSSAFFFDSITVFVDNIHLNLTHNVRDCDIFEITAVVER